MDQLEDFTIEDLGKTMQSHAPLLWETLGAILTAGRRKPELEIEDLPDEDEVYWEALEGCDMRTGHRDPLAVKRLTTLLIVSDFVRRIK